VNSEPDGYTLLGSAGAAINATLYDKLNFDFLSDIAPVAGIIRVPNVMAVTPSLPVKTVPEFLAYAKANPDKIKLWVGRHGFFEPSVRRAAQDDDRRANGARPLPRRPRPR